MNILVVGRGGREHTICWKLSQSPKVSKLYCAPGNAGIANVAELVAINETEFDKLTAFAKENAVDLAVIGPEDPLFEGIADAFEAAGIKVFGPSKAAAIIEGSKSFTKDLLKKYSIPTAAYETFTAFEPALEYVRKQGAPIVIKADGLAAGKGVTVAQTLEEAEEALRTIMLDKAFGAAGDKVVVEECLFGQEMSILAFVDGETVRPMPEAQDHKPIFDNDKGPNTGGMGTYSPVPHMPKSVYDEAVETIIKPTAAAMVKEGRPFRGVLFAGLMITPEGKPKTIEFNCRFGDPETQVVLSRLESDLAELFLATVEGRLAEVAPPKWSDDSAVCVVLAAGGYPGSYRKGDPIEGLDEVQESIVFHAGTSTDAQGRIVTNGGRLLGVTTTGATIDEARRKAYADVDRIRYDGKQYRTDIGKKALV
ncbi:phosphoribosylamine--glycine ligase [Paenibacillus sp.]|uniref:phosphoribosylamine--glycine ligase n=1 Tax=Paenibacillus sp. TaxID=58172 RepID=UPI002D36FA58|nr:phosphoribosylamine--glycine ligase [Paenibacillus sp.]HZG88303.1 phosphoribosylamine--glycine ligase [Paenibacillus sp.]